MLFSSTSLPNDLYNPFSFVEGLKSTIKASGDSFHDGIDYSIVTSAKIHIIYNKKKQNILKKRCCREKPIPYLTSLSTELLVIPSPYKRAGHPSRGVPGSIL